MLNKNLNVREKYWHRTFEIGLLFKGVDGLLEIIGGILIFFIKPEAIGTIARILTQHELSTDPRDFLANYILKHAQGISQGTLFFAGIFLLSHGIIKVFLVENLYKNKLWAYPMAIIVFILFIFYQIYRYAYSHSIGLLILTVLDIIVVLLTWHEYEYLKNKASL